MLHYLLDQSQRKLRTIHRVATPRHHPSPSTQAPSPLTHNAGDNQVVQVERPEKEPSEPRRQKHIAWPEFFPEPEHTHRREPAASTQRHNHRPRHTHKTVADPQPNNQASDKIDIVKQAWCEMAVYLDTAMNRDNVATSWQDATLVTVEDETTTAGLDALKQPATPEPDQPAHDDIPPVPLDHLTNLPTPSARWPYRHWWVEPERKRARLYPESFQYRRRRGTRS